MCALYRYQLYYNLFGVVNGTLRSLPESYGHDWDEDRDSRLLQGIRAYTQIVGG